MLESVRVNGSNYQLVFIRSSNWVWLLQSPLIRCRGALSKLLLQGVVLVSSWWGEDGVTYMYLGSVLRGEGGYNIVELGSLSCNSSGRELCLHLGEPDLWISWPKQRVV